MKGTSRQLCLLLLMMAFNGHDSAKSVYDSFEPKTTANETGSLLFLSICSMNLYAIMLSYIIMSSYDLRFSIYFLVLTKIFNELGSINDEISKILTGQNKTSSKLDKVLDHLDNDGTDTGKVKLNP